LHVHNGCRTKVKGDPRTVPTPAVTVMEVRMRSVMRVVMMLVVVWVVVVVMLVVVIVMTKTTIRRMVCSAVKEGLMYS